MSHPRRPIGRTLPFREVRPRSRAGGRRGICSSLLTSFNAPSACHSEWSVDTRFPRKSLCDFPPAKLYQQDEVSLGHKVRAAKNPSAVFSPRHVHARALSFRGVPPRSRAGGRRGICSSLLTSFNAPSACHSEWSVDTRFPRKSLCDFRVDAKQRIPLRAFFAAPVHASERCHSEESESVAQVRTRREARGCPMFRFLKRRALRPFVF